MKISGWSLIRLFTLFVYITMFAPIVVVIILSFNPLEFASFPMEGFSFRWYVRLAQNQAIVTAFKTSLILGFITSVISTAIAIPAAMAFVRYDFPGKNTLNTLLLTPIMIPEVILGVALLLIVNLANVLLQVLVSDNLRGRVMSIYSLTHFGFMPIGGLFAGLIAEYAGEPATVIICGLLCLVSSVVLWVYTPMIRRVE